jgi:hypothetical protein
MFVISGNTELFGDYPPRQGIFPAADPYGDSFRSEVAVNWNLIGIDRRPLPPPASEPDIVEQKGQTAIPKRPQILKNSTGSRVFELLSQMKPSTDRPPLTIPEPKADPDHPKRKLKFGP